MPAVEGPVKDSLEFLVMRALTLNEGSLQVVLAPRESRLRHWAYSWVHSHVASICGRGRGGPTTLGRGEGGRGGEEGAELTAEA